MVSTGSPVRIRAAACVAVERAPWIGLEWGEQDSNLRRLQPSRLQRDPFGRSGIPPSQTSFDSRAASLGGMGSPPSTSNLAYFGPPRGIAEPPPSAREGMNQRRPSRTSAKRSSHTEAACLRRVAQPLRLGQTLELLQRVVLDLANSLARHAEGAPHLLERSGLVALEPVAHLDHLALAPGQRVERAADVLAAEVLARQLEGRLGGLVLHEVAELGVLLLTDRLLERHRQLGDAQDVLHLARRPLQLEGDLLGRGLATELLH